VGSTVKPVTQVAEVAVKRASTKGVTLLLLEETGNINRIVPRNITNKKLNNKVTGGLVDNHRYIFPSEKRKSINWRK